MKARLLLILIGIQISSAVFAEQDKQNRLKQIAREVISAAGVSSLITVDSEGQPRSRAVASFEPDDNFVVWIATRPVTRKVDQIRDHKQVTLYYFDSATNSYVSIMGQAELVEDVDVKTKMRREQDSERFYPNFPDDYLLIKVTPSWMEVLGGEFRGDTETWRPERVDF